MCGKYMQTQRIARSTKLSCHPQFGCTSACGVRLHFIAATPDAHSGLSGVQQLGYLTNHKCNTAGNKCNTGSPEGYSYIMGCASSHVLEIQEIHGCCI
jgi:hypothetical protein